jgi:hypothetical protein
MALTSNTIPASTQDTGKSAVSTDRTAKWSPAFTAPLFFIALFLVFLGERVLQGTTTSRMLVTGAGMLGLVAATIVRWATGGRVPGERGRIERLLGGTQIAAVVAVVVALLSSSLGARLIGLETLDAVARERWDTILLVMWVTLLLCSVLTMAFAEAALVPMRRAPLPESRRIKSAAAAGLVLGLAVAYLSLFVASARHYGVAVDFAFFKTAKPSDSTLRIAASLKDSVRVVAFFPAVNEVRNEVEQYMRTLGRSNPKLKFEFVDRVLSPKVARELRVSQDGAIVLVRGEAREMLNVGVEMKSARTTLRNLDQEFQKSLMKIARDARIVYLTTGHHELNDRMAHPSPVNENGISILRKLLEMQNYRVLDLGMSQGLASEVPADANLVMVLGPREPFAVAEIAALKRYAERGGALLLGLDPEALADQPDTAKPVPSAVALVGPKDEGAALAAGLASGGVGPDLDALAGLCGLAVDPAILTNDKTDFVSFAGNKSDRARIVSNRFGSHASVSTLSRHQAWVVLFGAGSLKKLDPNDRNIDFALRSTTTTFQDKNRNFEADTGESRASYDLAAAVTHKLAAPPAGGGKAGSSPEQRAFVVADADLFGDLVLKNVPTNRYLLLDAVRWLGGEESLSGAVNSEEDVRIEHKKDKDVLWFYATILGVPLLVLGLGLLWSHRSKGQGGNR